jgi:hypothetical protein
MLNFLDILFCAGGTLFMGLQQLLLTEQKVTACMLLTLPYQGFSAQVPLLMENLILIQGKGCSMELL